MFILYALVIGLALGFLLGGRLTGLATIEFRWPWLAIGGFLLQAVLFSDAVRLGVGSLGPPLYVASTAAVLVAVVRNIRVPGLALVAVGAASNFVAIVSNGGFMPASAEAFAALGGGLNEGYTNSAIVENPAFAPLTDIYALPPWLPFSNVFSVGDVLIAAGVVMVIVLGMRARVPAPGESVPAEPGRSPLEDAGTVPVDGQP